MTVDQTRLDGVVILDGGASCQPLPLVEDGGGVAHAVVWPGVGAFQRTFHRFRLEPLGRTRAQRHGGEAVYYVVRGRAVVRDDSGAAHELREGSMVHVDAGTGYTFEAGGQGSEIVGGPCPADPDLYGLPPDTA